MRLGGPDGGSYDLVVVGSGFAGSFFLARYLKHAPATARALVLERGPLQAHADRIASKASHAFPADRYYTRSGTPAKKWAFTLGFGGGSNCWWANAPRFLPADFEMKRRFGVGRDWPIGYDDLAPHYTHVEQVMAISGPAGAAPYPRDRPYPQPQHRMTDPERRLKAAYPDRFFTVPTGRARIATEGRSACCANGVCHACPVDAKFTVLNSLAAVYDDPRVTVALEAEVVAVEHGNGVAKAVVYASQGAERRVAGNLVVLGANAIFNSIILERSSLGHPVLGRGLNEQVGLRAEAYLDGVDSFQGSTSVTGFGYMLYSDEARRRDVAACLIETWNVGLLRTEFGKWRQVLPMRLVFDDLPSDANHVRVDPANPGRPIVHYAGHSDYTERAIARAHADLERVLAPLPVEKIVVAAEIEPTESHIIGTTPMGDDPATSIVDRDCVHHGLRNLVVLGSGTFPVGGPANPTLTISALATRAADRLMA